jgi:hypothetical protein
VGEVLMMRQVVVVVKIGCWVCCHWEVQLVLVVVGQKVVGVGVGDCD